MQFLRYTKDPRTAVIRGRFLAHNILQKMEDEEIQRHELTFHEYLVISSVNLVLLKEAPPAVFLQYGILQGVFLWMKLFRL